ncbi:MULTISPECIES: DNA replication/repair protein RecF [unclassified Iodidimonas]|uniref:DNA replication/repair protein RecF n=1 Tax=unclassified Iodidimonas TaxID=2626145 RepID=UPI0024829B98|nr:MULTISPECIES: DNA replication/repair protein RecF [unclassified Iodidimonas]
MPRSTHQAQSLKPGDAVAYEQADARQQSGPRRASSCFIARLDLAHFRSYPHLSLRLPIHETAPAPVVLVGPNGAGKTNLLEALSCLSPGRGLRGAGLHEITAMGSSAPWAVHARLHRPDAVFEIGTGLAPGIYADSEGDDEGGASRRVVRIDGETVSGSGHLARIVSVLWLTPAMDRLFMEAGSGRRRFLDRIVLALHGDHSRQVNAYERAMRERNRLLSERGPGFDNAWLSALEARMAAHGVAIAAARLETLDDLGQRLKAIPEGPFPLPLISLQGYIEDQLAISSALEAEEAFKSHLAAMRRRDAAAGRTGDGPHRSDLIVVHQEKAMPAHLCSTGEQKGLLISIILAHADMTADQTGHTPILLLDEVAAHLDEDRRAALFERLLALGGQAFMTGTDAALFAALGGRADIFHIGDGQVRLGSGAP